MPADTSHPHVLNNFFNFLYWMQMQAVSSEVAVRLNHDVEWIISTPGAT
jgi:hypothetical protein